MHYAIRILTEGRNHQEAHRTAIGYADSMVDGGEFDYHYGAEQARTYRLSSALGQRAVEAAMRATRAEFDQAIHVARLMLRDFTDEQIYEEDYRAVAHDYYAARYQFSQVGDGHVYLYGAPDIWGGKVRNDHDLQAITAMHDDLWVTCLGFHN